MKNNQKGFIVPLLIAIIALLIVGSGAYIYLTQQKTTQINGGDNGTSSPSLINFNDESTTNINSTDFSSNSIQSPLNYLVNGATLQVSWNNKLVQTLTLDKVGLEIWNDHKPLAFIIDKDINFDGYKDVGVLALGGYNSIYCYNFYVFNASTHQLEPSDLYKTLGCINSPTIDPVKKQVLVPTAIAGQNNIYQWTGATWAYTENNIYNQPTLNWTTYSDSIYGLTFQYPSSFGQIQKSVIDNITTLQFYPNTSFSVGIGPHYSPTLGRNLTLDEYISALVPYNPNSSSQKKQIISINGTSATRLSATNGYQTVDSLFVPLKNSAIALFVYIHPTTDTNFELIISSIHITK